MKICQNSLRYNEDIIIKLYSTKCLHKNICRTSMNKLMIIIKSLEKQGHKIID